MAKKLISYDDAASPGARLPAPVRSELDGTYVRSVNGIPVDPETGNVDVPTGGGGGLTKNPETGMYSIPGSLTKNPSTGMYQIGA